MESKIIKKLAAWDYTPYPLSFNPPTTIQEIEQYRREEDELENEFKQDAFEELGILEHPKREELYSLARNFADNVWGSPSKDDRFILTWEYMKKLAKLIKD